MGKSLPDVTLNNPSPIPTPDGRYEDEKAKCLQLILKDVVLSKETIQLNIYDLPEFNYESSKKRQDWLPR